MDKIRTVEKTANFSGKRDVVLLILGASRKDGEHITDGQVGSALNTAKSVLQMVGAYVDAASSAFLLPDDAFAEGETLTVRTLVEMFKESASDASSAEPTDGDATEGEAEEQTGGEEGGADPDGDSNDEETETPPNGELGDSEEPEDDGVNLDGIDEAE